MSASTTNIEKQAKRHRGPLIGIALVLVWAGVLFAGFMIWTAYMSDNPSAQSPVSYIAE